MKKMSSQPIIEDSEDMENVELHRANSLVNPPIEFEKQTENSTERKELHSYVYLKTVECFTFIRGLKIEVVMFMYMFSSVLRMVSTTTMIMDKVCLVHLNYSKEVCDNLAEYQDKKNIVEKLANNYSVGHTMISMLPACIIAAFVGSWSDKYGRKIPLIFAIVGIILDGLSITVCAAVFYSRVEFVLLSGLFSGLSGGMISVLTVLYSYASDITTFGQRTMKYAIMEMAFGFSMPMGQLVGGWLYKISETSENKYIPVFLLSTAGHLFSLGWVLFVLKETKGLDNTDHWTVKLRTFFSLEPVKDSIRATMKDRPNRGKTQILLLILAMSITVLSYASAGGISYLYAHHQYDWNNTQYSTVSATFSVIGIVFMVIVVPIFKRLKLGDSVLGIVGNASILAKNITMGFAVHVGLYFLAHLFGLLGGVANLAGRSRISKVTSNDDLGKVFAFLSTAESLLPIIASVIVSQIFNASLDFYPGLVFLGVGALMVIPLLVFIWLGRLPSVDYEQMHEQQKRDDEAMAAQQETQLEKIKY